MDREYSYALMLQEWRDSRDRIWFSGYAIQSNDKGGSGVYSYGRQIVDCFGPRLKPSEGYVEWFREANDLPDTTYVDLNVWQAKTKRMLLRWWNSAYKAMELVSLGA